MFDKLQYIYIDTINTSYIKNRDKIHFSVKKWLNIIIKDILKGEDSLLYKEQSKSNSIIYKKPTNFNMAKYFFIIISFY